jgi:hypothetical protein
MFEVECVNNQVLRYWLNGNRLNAGFGLINYKSVAYTRTVVMHSILKSMYQLG